MTTRSLAVALLAVSAAFAQVPAPDFDVYASTALMSSAGLQVQMTTSGPPLTQFTVYYLIGDLTTTPLELMPFGPLYSGQTGPTGTHVFQLPIPTPPGFTIPEFRMAAVFVPPAAPPVVTEIVALSLTANPPAAQPPPCNVRVASLALEHNPCMITLDAKVCAGDVVQIKKNGVVIASGVAGASGVVILSVGGPCAGVGDTIEATVNGVNLAGPIHGP